MEIVAGAVAVAFATVAYGVYRHLRSDRGPERSDLAHVMAPVRPRPGSRGAAVALEEPDEN